MQKYCKPSSASSTTTPTGTVPPAADENEAVELFTRQLFDVVMLGSGMDDASESRMKPIFREINPSVKFIQHYGGGSGLLAGEIYQALSS